VRWLSELTVSADVLLSLHPWLPPPLTSLCRARRRRRPPVTWSVRATRQQRCQRSVRGWERL